MKLAKMLRIIAISLISLVFLYANLNANAKPIEATVTIDVKKKMEPLDPVLWPGNYFDKEAATALLKDDAQSSSIWKKIPAWQAGNWEQTQATITKAVKYINGQPAIENIPIGVYTAKRFENFGWQKDKNNDIWQLYSLGYWTKTELDDCKAYYSYIKFSAPGANDYPDYYAEMVSFYVDRATNKILDVQQGKQWNRYIYLAPDIMKEEAVYTVFNEKG